MASIRTLILLVAVLLPLQRIQAQNMIANAGFTDVNICTEYSYPCAPSAWESVAPNTSKLMYTADKGNRYITLTLYSSIDPDFRTYSQTQLLCPLQKGQQYLLKIYLLMDEDRPYPLPAVLFDTVAVYRWTPRPLQVVPTFYFSRTTDKHAENKWTVLEKTFTAPASANHLVIGNFDTSTANYPNKADYYLSIDSISLTPLSGQLCTSAAVTKKILYAQHDRHHYISPNNDGEPQPVAPTLQTVFFNKGACDTLLLKNDFFVPGTRYINSAYSSQLEKILQLQGDNVRNKIKLTGYVFRHTNEKYNEILGQDRAKAVASYLVYQKGYSFDDFIIAGIGKCAPGGDSTERVEFISCQPAGEVTVPVTHTDTLLIPDLLFEVNSHQLNHQMLGALDSLIGRIPAGDHISVTVTGHTDNTGTPVYNQELSMRRAFTVSDYIREKDPAIHITEVTGMGESVPVADNNTAAGRRKNRRVEIVIYHLSQ
ncbi:OmpA family protein [Chitinophaga eiseniae]|uniref:OmpA family protein n=1 Tax=Chitinophaga eiseniae TaxID=634771 RepID=A0A847SMK9_9BACT|nr:OmpA family protein [Chitinophaga eiseniae]NLR80465.1 OmpA family protein [Chitinophaga eiseniae]